MAKATMATSRVATRAVRIHAARRAAGASTGRATPETVLVAPTF